MENIKVLVAMQLKEKLNLKGTNLKSKTTFYKAILSILKFALIVALCFLLLFLCQFLGLFSLTKHIPTSVIAIVFSLMLLLQIISEMASLTKSLYFAKDNPILLVLPCKHVEIYLSKIIVAYLYDLIKNMSFMIPLFFAYGILSGFGFVYYIWVLFCFLFISLIPVLLGSILSIPSMWFYSKFKQYKIIQVISILGASVLATIVIIKGISLIPSNINLVETWGTTFWQIQDVLNNFTNNFSILYGLVEMIVGERIELSNVLFTSPAIFAFLQLVLVLLVLFGLGFVTVKPLFYKMASKPFEYTKSYGEAKQNKQTNKLISVLKTEFLLNLRDSSKLFSNIVLMISMPILILLLNKIFGAMDTRLVGDSISIAFNILIILLISLSSNYYAASVFSKDGRSSYLIKTQPSKCEPLLLSKIVFNSLFMICSFIATGVVLVKASSLSADKAIIITLGCMFMYFAHLFFSAELDIMNPKIELYATINDDSSNPNETKSTVISFLASFVVFGILLFLLLENDGLITYIKILAIGLVMMIFRLYSLLAKIKLYYKEKDV